MDGREFLYDDTHVENLLLKFNILDAAYERPGPRLELTNPDHRLSIAFRHMVEERFAEGWTVERYARELAVSEKHLGAAVSATLHITPYRYLRQRMATEAGRQLLYTDRSLTEIAADFDMDPSNFNKFFRTFHNLSPADYREEYAALRRVEPL